MFTEISFIKNKDDLVSFINKIFDLNKSFKKYVYLHESKNFVFDFTLKNKLSKINLNWLSLNNLILKDFLNYKIFYKFHDLSNEDKKIIFNNFNFFNPNEILFFKAIGTDKLQDITEAVPRIQNLFELTLINTELDVFNNFVFLDTTKLKNVAFSIYSKFILNKQIQNKSFNFVHFINFSNLINPEQLSFRIFENYIKKFSFLESLNYTIIKIQNIIVRNLEKIYLSQGIKLSRSNFEVLVRLLCNEVEIISACSDSPFFINERLNLTLFYCLFCIFKKYSLRYPLVLPQLKGAMEITKTQESFLSSVSFQNTSEILIKSALLTKKDWIYNLKSELILNKLQTMGTHFVNKNNQDIILYPKV